MKIGIITIHRSPSYGGSLQAYALFRYLSNMGYDVEIIDLLRPTHQEYRYSFKYHKMRLRFYEYIKNAFYAIGRVRSHKFDPIAYNEKFVEFNKQLKLSKTYTRIDDIYSTPPNYDVYITGSDQVWNPAQPYAMEPYFLTFVNSGRKISYAASVGLEDLLPKERKKFKKWIEAYDCVSVREISIKKYLESFIDKKIERVADPSFLLSRNEWQSISIKPEHNNYILLFELRHNPLLINYCKQLASQSGKSLFVLGQKEPISDEYTTINDAGPLEFIGYIEEADMVITDSFHGTVFSIIMNTCNFYTYIAPGNKKGSRIIDLLKLHNISNHLLDSSLTQTWDNLSGNEINREIVDECYHREQKLSQDFLTHSLM